MKKFLLPILAFLILFASCSGISDFTENDYKDKSVSSQLGATVSVRFESDSERTIMPSVSSIESFSKYELLGKKSGQSEFTSLGVWLSYASMMSEKVSLETGVWTFKLTATNGSLLYSSLLTDKKIDGGNTELSFVLSLDNIYQAGTGNAAVTLKYPKDAPVKNIKVILYDINGDVVEEPERETSLRSFTPDGSGSLTYAEALPSATYRAVFYFSAESDGMGNYLGVWQDYIVIVDGMASVGSHTINRLNDLYTITYELNGGKISPENTVLPASYTRIDPSVILPPGDAESTSEVYPAWISKDGYIFDAWYENEKFSGNPLSYISDGMYGNKTLYARWLKKCTVTFHLGENTATQTVTEGVATPLALFESNFSSTNAFIGWSYTESGETVYADGGACTVSEDIDLFAVFGGTKKLDPQQGETTDTDKDGLTDYDEVYTYGTNPLNKDTDGDGWDDYEEIIKLQNKATNTFNPLIADLPKLEIELVSAPKIFYKYTTSESKTQQESLNTTETGTFSHSTNSTNSRSSSFSFSLSESMRSAAKYAANSVPSETSSEMSFGSGQNWNSSDSYSFSKGETATFAKAMASGKVSSNGQTRSISGGMVKMVVKFKNPSSIAYNITNANLEACRIVSATLDPTKSIIEPVGTLEKKSVNITLEPNSSSGYLNYELNLTQSETEELLRNSAGLEIGLAGYAIKMGGKDFTQEFTTSAQQTALVTIDYGPTSQYKTETFHVATNRLLDTDPSSSNIYRTMLLGEVLSICVGADNYSVGNGLADKNKECSIISKIRDMENASDYQKDGAWFIMHTYYKDGSTTPIMAMYNPAVGDISKLEVHSRDTLTIFFDIDKDGDNVPLRIEKKYNSSDENPDTDGDGISDYEEIFGWKPSEKAGCTRDGISAITNTVRSHPNNEDTDGDDWKDSEDPNPIKPRDITDASIKAIRYTFSGSIKMGSTGETITSISSIPAVSNKKATFDKISTGAKSDVIYLDVTPKLLGTTVKYAVNTVNSLPQDSAFKTLSCTQGIKLESVKETYIFLRSTAPDNATVYDYTLPVESKFKELASLKVTTKGNDTKTSRMIFTYNTHMDSRAEGYVVVFSPSAKVTTLDPAMVTSAERLETNVSGKTGDFACKLSADDLKGGAFQVVNMKPVQKYYASVFAYRGTGSEFEYGLLGSGDCTTATPSKGRVRLTLNYLELMYDPNSTVWWPKYFWTYRAKADGTNIKTLSEKSQDQCVAFHMTKHKTESFNNAIYEFEFDTSKSHTLDLEQSLYMNGTFSNHQLVQSNFRTLTFTYDASEKKWQGPTTKISSGVGYSSGGKLKVGEKESYKHYCQHSSGGEMLFFFEFEWVD